jgi:hypothetical protein
VAEVVTELVPVEDCEVVIEDDCVLVAVLVADVVRVEVAVVLMDVVWDAVCVDVAELETELV